MRYLGLTLVLVACSGSSEQTAAPAVSSTAVSLDGISVSAPNDWRSTTPSSDMRKAQWAIADDTELVVFHFGGGGGSVEDNLDRWYGQFEQDDGSPTSADATVTTRTIAGMEVTTVDVGGRYVAETRPGSGERVNKPGYRMLAAIVIAPNGAYYFKLVGPEGHVANALPGFQALIDSLQPE